MNLTPSRAVLFCLSAALVSLMACDKTSSKSGGSGPCKEIRDVAVRFPNHNHYLYDGAMSGSKELVFFFHGNVGRGHSMTLGTWGSPHYLLVSFETGDEKGKLAPGIYKTVGVEAMVEGMKVVNGEFYGKETIPGEPFTIDFKPRDGDGNQDVFICGEFTHDADGKALSRPLRIGAHFRRSSHKKKITFRRSKK